MANDALIVVDAQVDFCPDGALPVPEGDLVMPVLNRCMSAATTHGVPIYASRDWHPEQTLHFKAQGGPWPPHCVAGTPGAEFHPALALPASAQVVSKGMSGRDDGYSAMEATLPSGQTLAESLRTAGVTRVWVGGLATDYCVRATVLDARKAGLDARVLTDAIRPVELVPGDGERALREMVDVGATLATADEMVAQAGS
jgi:nicotinamidase/pyrazinamidase